MKQGQEIIAKQAFSMKAGGARGRAVQVKVGDIFWITSPDHMNKTAALIQRQKKGHINTGYKLDLSDIDVLFDLMV